MQVLRFKLGDKGWLRLAGRSINHRSPPPPPSFRRHADRDPWILVGWALRLFKSIVRTYRAGAMPTRFVRVGKIARKSGARWLSSTCDFAHPTHPGCSRLRQLGVDVSAVDDDVLDEHARLDLVALEERGQHVDAEAAPFHRVQLDRHGEIVLLHRP